MTQIDTIAALALPYGFTVEAWGPGAMLYLARRTANGRSVTIGTGNETDILLEDADPALPLFLLGGMEADGDYLASIGEANPDPMPLQEALAKGQDIALTMDREAFPLLAREFPDYPIASLPPIPAHWVDRSWHNEPCPTFQIGEADGQIVFIDFPDPAVREFPEMKRFTVHNLDQNGQLGTDSMGLETDDWAEVLAEVESNERLGRLRSDTLTAEDIAAFMAENDAAEKPCPDFHQFLQAKQDEQVSAESILATFGFSVEVGGGGATFLSLYFGEYGKPDWHIWATDSGGGQSMPTTTDFWLCVYPPDWDGEEPAAQFGHEDGMPLEDAARVAVAFVTEKRG